MKFGDTHIQAPRNVNELMMRNDSASCNLLDMIDEGSLDQNDAGEIERLYLAHDVEFRCDHRKAQP